ncbi:ribokinase [Miniphocaeibacter halophilus]|uniref:Ribokinase n=1 Tax=Miniphocaeibacter halophilus TaxID=2931922 RepID=A0AC61MQ50_9FIRM|nr:ribokinase [Miniphocaeibacter halophilus]QQK07079.1 ribokinase [Miniphocaeibacter halophilus]
MKISVVGSINIDMDIVAERIPLKGETVKGSDIKYIPGGKGANQAVSMARLGADVDFYGCVGDDTYGEILLKNLKNENINTNNIEIVKNENSGMAIITIAENDNTIVVIPGANNYVSKDYVEKKESEILKSDLVVLQNEIPMETIKYVIDLCYKNNIDVLLNPAPAFKVEKELLDKVTYLTPNEHEAKLIFGENVSIDEMLRMHPNKLIITLGSKGAIFANEKLEIINLPARKAKVVDTTGAGDTFNGAFAVRISQGYDMEEALSFANIAASLSTEKFGAQTGMPTLSEVLETKEK